MEELNENPLNLDVTVAVDGDKIWAELDVRHNATVRVGDQYTARWEDGSRTILRVVGFKSAEDYSNTAARRTEAMREGVVGPPETLMARKTYQVKLALLRVEGELLADGSRLIGATRVPDVMVPIRRIKDDDVERFGTDRDGNVILGNLRSGKRMLSRLARILQNFAGERMLVLGMPGKGKTQFVRALLCQLISNPKRSADGPGNAAKQKSPIGFLVLDRKGEYIDDTLDQHGNMVFGLQHHPDAPQKMVVVSFRKQFRELADQRRIFAHLEPHFSIRDINPVDLVDFLRSLTTQQTSLIREYAHVDGFYDKLLVEQFGLVDKSHWFQDFPGLFELSKEGKALLKKARDTGRDELEVAEVEALQEHTGGSAAGVLERASQKIKRFCNSPFFGGSARGRDILAVLSIMGEILDHLEQGRFVFIDLLGLANDQYTLIAAMFARKLLTVNKARPDKDQIRACMVLEEAHNILSDEELSKGDGNGSVFIELAREGRSFKLGFVLVTQQPDAPSIEPQVAKTIDTVVAFGMPPDDARHLRRLKAGFADLELEIANAAEFVGIAVRDAGPVLFGFAPVDQGYMDACADGTLPEVIKKRGVETPAASDQSVQPRLTPSLEDRLATLMRQRQESIRPVALATMRAWRGEEAADDEPAF